MTKEIIEAGYEDLSNNIDISGNTELVDSVNNILKQLMMEKLGLLKND